MIAVIGTVVALAAAVGPAGAAVNTLTLTVSPSPVVVNAPVTFSGRLSGPGGVPIVGSSVDIAFFFGAGCTAGGFVGALPTQTTDGSGRYSFGPVPATVPPGTYSFQAFGGGTSSACVNLTVLAFAVQANVSSAYLCYSTYQTEPGVWPAAEALVLANQGYWEPTAVDGNIPGGTNVGNYHLQCNVPPKGDGYVGAGGEFYGPDMAATARQNLGFYPH
ncbi:MAG TPA: hypothetical protein VGU02_11990 [Gaiellaceae bacterium]|nr:hypothetical protein [Gaiellaceae bacterium]